MHASLPKPVHPRQPPVNTGRFRPARATRRHRIIVAKRGAGIMANGTSNEHTTQELRRDKRFQVSQAAIITQPGHTEIACEIRDFCFGGVLLKFTNPEAAFGSRTKRAEAEGESVR